MSKRIRTQTDQSKVYRVRIRFAMMVTIGLFVVILARLYSLQVLNYKSLKSVADFQTSRKVVIPAHRGEIRDRNGIVLATTVFRETIFLDPAKFGDQGFEITRAIANAIGADRKELEKKIGKKVTPVAHRLSPERCREILSEVDKINPKPPFGAVFSTTESVRLYPKGALGATLIGFWGEDGRSHKEQGVAGLEKTFEDLLRGKEQAQRVMTSRFGQAIQPLDEDLVHASNGNTIELTIDSKIQYFAENALARRVMETGGLSGACVVMDPRNGDLLAVASYPSFEPDNPATRVGDNMRNRAFEYAVEPGSVMKIFTYATAMEMNLFSPTEPVDCEGKSYRFTEGRVGRTITDFHGMGVVPFEEAFWESSNIAAVKLGLRIPDIDFYDVLSRLQFAERTGLNFPGEARGHLTNLPWSFMTRTSVPFGYEVSANSVQMAACISAIANGGVKMQPRLIRRLVSSRGETVEEYQPKELGRIFSEATSQLMTEFMEGVVVEGTGKPAAVNGYRVAGKTGTTRKTGRADDDRAYLASFAGFLPVSDPQLVIYCWIDEPQKASDSYTGGRASAPIFQEVATQAVRSLEIPPDGEFLPEAPPSEVAEVGLEAPVEDVAIEETSQPIELATRPVYDKRLAEEFGLMPDLTGMTKREVSLQLSDLKRKKREIKMTPRFYGNGIVVRQDPPPMTPLENVSECSIQFGEPGEIKIAVPVNLEAASQTVEEVGMLASDE